MTGQRLHTNKVSKEKSAARPLVLRSAHRLSAVNRYLGVTQPLALQTKLVVGQADDTLEREADQVADEVMRMSAPKVQRKARDEREVEGIQPLKPLHLHRVSREASGHNGAPPIVHDALRTAGRPLDPATRRFMELRFGHGFGGVRIHSDGRAATAAQAVQARAFTLGRDVVFRPGAYAPGSQEGRRLLAHELTHVVQQREQPRLQRAVEIRPPGRGEASAFGRRQELIDRLNAQSSAVQYRLEGRRLRCRIIDESALTHFDHQMCGFVHRTEVVPLRLITGSGYVGGRPLFVDSLQEAYVDLDDLLASGDLSFQLNLIHILTERFGVQNYEHRIGTPMREFDRVHRAALRAEAVHLRSVIGDPSIRFNYEERRHNGTYVFAFLSQEGYRVFHVFRRIGREVTHGVIWVRTRDGRRLTVEEFRHARAGRADAREGAFRLPRPGPSQNPFPHLHLAPELNLHLDPELQADINGMGRIQELLDPERIRSSILHIDFNDLRATQPPPWLTMPVAPAPTPLVPRGVGPSTPRAATRGDLMRAILHIPAVDSTLIRLRTQAGLRIRHDWRRLSTGARVLLIGQTALITGTALAGVLSNPEARQFTLGLIQNRDIPVPGVPGLSFRLDLTGPDRSIRFNLNLGALLPAEFGFRR